MNAKIEELEGKYYGTKISLMLDDGTESEIEVWIHDKSCQASHRELERGGYKTNAEAVADGWICDSHYESKIGYEICERIINALNAPNVEELRGRGNDRFFLIT